MDKKELMDHFKAMTYGTRIDGHVIESLDKMGYFDAPASKGHHLAEPGGLVTHSLGVAMRLRTLTTHLNLTWQRDDSPEVIGVLHDLCKCDAYIPKYQDVQTINLDPKPLGQAPDMPSFSYGRELVGYEWNDHQLINGHGDKSVMIASTLLQLTMEEVMCIRYHMGPYSDDAKERNAYTEAVKKYHNVLACHTADMWSSQIDNC